IDSILSLYSPLSYYSLGAALINLSLSSSTYILFINPFIKGNEMIKSPPRYARHSRFFVGILTTSMTLFALSGCNNVTPSVNNQTIKRPNAAVTSAVQPVVGDYASDGYAKRAQGYDWVGVMIKADGADNGEQIDIKVRARSDVKKPTCHFDGKATLMGQ